MENIRYLLVYVTSEAITQHLHVIGGLIISPHNIKGTVDNEVVEYLMLCDLANINII